MHHAPLGILERQNRIAAVVGEVLAEQYADMFRCAVAVGGLSVLNTYLGPAEVLAQLEVQHARDCIGTIGRGSTARNDFDIFDHRHGNGVEIHRTVRIRRHQAPTVHQDQRAVGTEAAQVAVRLAAGKAGRALNVPDFAHTLSGRELRHLADCSIESRLSRGGQRRLVYRDDRAVGLKVSAGNA